MLSLIPWPKIVTTGTRLIRKHIVILLVTDQENAIPNIIAGGCEVPFWCPRSFRFSISLFFSPTSLFSHLKKIWSNSGWLWHLCPLCALEDP